MKKRKTLSNKNCRIDCLVNNFLISKISFQPGKVLNEKSQRRTRRKTVIASWTLNTISPIYKFIPGEEILQISEDIFFNNQKFRFALQTWLNQWPGKIWFSREKREPEASFFSFFFAIIHFWLMPLPWWR